MAPVVKFKKKVFICITNKYMKFSKMTSFTQIWTEAEGIVDLLAQRFYYISSYSDTTKATTACGTFF